MADETYLVFGDESGTADLRDDPYFPVFVVAMCAFEESAYRDKVVPMFEELKLRHFGRRDAPLHERDIRRRSGIFATLNGEQGWREFAEDLTEVIRTAPFKIAAVAIDKRAQSRFPMHLFDLYSFSVNAGLERIQRHLLEIGANDQPRRIILESRGKREDRELADEIAAFQRVAHRSLDIEAEIEFETKEARLVGLEIADLVAYPIARHVIERPQPKLPFDALDGHFLRGSDGSSRGWGLTVVPR